MTAIVQIRAHHAFCLQGFQGKGYSDAFVQNFAAILAKLKKDPDQKIQLVVGQDDFCKPCPHHHEQGCQKFDHADAHRRGLDEAALAILHLKKNQALSFSALLTQSKNTVTAKNQVTAVCGECPWQSSCLFHQNLM